MSRRRTTLMILPQVHLRNGLNRTLRSELSSSIIQPARTTKRSAGRMIVGWHVPRGALRLCHFLQSHLQTTAIPFRRRDRLSLKQALSIYHNILSLIDRVPPSPLQSVNLLPRCDANTREEAWLRIVHFSARAFVRLISSACYHPERSCLSCCTACCQAAAVPNEL